MVQFPVAGDDSLIAAGIPEQGLMGTAFDIAVNKGK